MILSVRRSVLSCIVLISLFGRAGTIFADSMLLELVSGKLWVAPDIELGYVQFTNDNKYELGAYEGAGVLATGSYAVRDSAHVSLNKPTITNPGLEIAQKAAGWINEQWPGDSILLIYDPQYADLLYTGALRNEKGRVLFISTQLTPEGMVVERDGAKMIKKKGLFIVTDNLVMRKGPSKGSDSTSYSIKDILSKYGYQTPKELNVRILPKGYELDTEGYTTTTSTIDGRTAPWYLYSIESWDGFMYYQGWVFGGYLLPFTTELSAKYKSMMDKTIKDLNWVDETASASPTNR